MNLLLADCSRIMVLVRNVPGRVYITAYILPAAGDGGALWIDYGRSCQQRLSLERELK